MRSITNLTLGAVLCFFAVATAATARRTEIRMADYGIVPGTGQDLTPALNRALAAIKAAEGGGRNVTLSFEPGQYTSMMTRPPARRTMSPITTRISPNRQCSRWRAGTG